MEQSTTMKSSPRDVFMYLFATVALYFSAYSIISLLFDYVNVLIPDPLNLYYDPGSSIRWSMALLIIIFPAYVWVSRFLHLDLLVTPEKSEIRVRKWLLYLTLFLAALLIIGDLVALIFNFLQGEFTVRFLLKILVVLGVGAAIFWYYLYDLRTKASPLNGRAFFFVRGTTALVAVIVVAGFFVAGSPFTARLVRFDAQKVSDLQNIQGQVVNYWQLKQKLPQALGDLRNDIAGYVAPTDPQSGAVYEYQATGVLTFTLCAEFNLPSSAGVLYDGRTVKMLPSGSPASENWEHAAGRACFSRTIDPQLYAPQKLVPVMP